MTANTLSLRAKSTEQGIVLGIGHPTAGAVVLHVGISPKLPQTIAKTSGIALAVASLAKVLNLPTLSTSLQVIPFIKSKV